MNQPLPRILPDLPNTEPFQELRFHLQELHWDLKALAKEIEALSPTIPDNPHRFYRIEWQHLRSIKSKSDMMAPPINHYISIPTILSK